LLIAFTVMDEFWLLSPKPLPLIVLLLIAPIVPAVLSTFTPATVLLVMKLLAQLVRFPPFSTSIPVPLAVMVEVLRLPLPLLVTSTPMVFPVMVEVLLVTVTVAVGPVARIPVAPPLIWQLSVTVADALGVWVGSA
jgi:hypothetical protein